MLYSILRKEIMPSGKMYLQTCLSFMMVFLLSFSVCVYWNYTTTRTVGHDVVFSGDYGDSFGDWQILDYGAEFLSALENADGLKAYGIFMSPITKNVEPSYIVTGSGQFFEDNLSPYIVSGSQEYGENILWIGNIFAALTGLEVGDTVDGEIVSLTVGAIVDTFDAKYNNAMFMCLDDGIYNRIAINFDSRAGKENYYSVMFRFRNEGKLNGQADELYRGKENAMKRMTQVGLLLCAFAFLFEVLPVAYMLKGQQRKMDILNALGYRRERIIGVYLRLILTRFLVAWLLSNIMIALVTGLKGKMKFSGIMQYTAYDKEFIFFQGIVAAVLFLIAVLSLTAVTRNSRKTLKVL